MTLDDLISELCELRKHHALSGRASVQIRSYKDRWEYQSSNIEKVRIERNASTTFVYIKLEDTEE